MNKFFWDDEDVEWETEEVSGISEDTGAEIDKDYNPNQPRVPAGNSAGGQFSSTGGSSTSGTLKSGVPGYPISTVASVLEKHPAWTPEQAQKYSEQVNRLHASQDPNEIKVDKNGPERWKQTIQDGRKAIRQVHKEVGGYSVLSVSQTELDNIVTPGCSGAYKHRTLWVATGASKRTFVHESGHYLDDMLGLVHSGGKGGFMSESDQWSKYFEGKDKSDRRETFAEFYEAWIRTRGDVSKTVSQMRATFVRGGKDVMQPLAVEWDALLRTELEMR